MDAKALATQRILNNLASIEEEMNMEMEIQELEFDALEEFCKNPTKENRENVLKCRDENYVIPTHQNSEQIEGIAENVQFEEITNIPISIKKQKAYNIKTMKSRIGVKRSTSVASERSISNSSIEILNNEHFENNNNYFSDNNNNGYFQNDRFHQRVSSQISRNSRMEIEIGNETEIGNVTQRVNDIDDNETIEISDNDGTSESEQQDGENAEIANWCNSSRKIKENSKRNFRRNPIEIFGDVIDLIIDLDEIFGTNWKYQRNKGRKYKPISDWKNDKLSQREIVKYQKHMNYISN